MRVQQVEAYLRERRDEHLRQLMDFLRIPSVSALSEHRSDVRRAAEWLAAEMRRIGLNRVEMMETGGHPVVYAERLDNPGRPDRPDLRPLRRAARRPDGRSGPRRRSSPTIRDGKLYARGASDDKGQVFMHLKVDRGLLAAEGGCPST